MFPLLAKATGLYNLLPQQIKDNPLKYTTIGLAASALGTAAAVGTGGNKTMATASMGRGIDLIPGYDVNWGGILPGGDPFIVPEAGGTQTTVGWAYGWTANGTVFYRSSNGGIGCYTKGGVWKQWRPYKPVVFGKHTDLAKLVKVAASHKKTYNAAKSLFGERIHASKKHKR